MFCIIFLSKHTVKKIKK